jgi:serine/threonine-protein kinase
MSAMPEQLGKYRIDSVLGKGAMGTVYKAFDPHIARTVALKTIRKELFGEGQQAELIGRFKNEAQAAGRLMHPNIVAVYDYGEDEEAAYIAMEFIDGLPLNGMLKPQQASEPARALDWIGQLLRALDYAHARGVVHRDIKPANLLITADGQVKITDFGIARIESSTLTQTGSMIGTPSYMSPEQFRGDPVDGRSDVFSAAIVLYQLLTGERAFAGSATVVMQQILNQMPPPVSTLNPALDPALDAIIARALAKLPEHRYATARLFLDALHGQLDQHDHRGQRDQAAAGFGAVPAVAPILPARFAAAEDDDRTMLAGQGNPGLFVPGPAPGDNSVGAATDTGTQTPWKLATLPELEVLLTHQIGPMARLLLKKAATQAGDLDALCAALLPHIPSERGRQQFTLETERLKQRLNHAASGEVTSANSNGATRSGIADTAGTGGTRDTGDTGGAAAAATTASAGYDQAFADATQRRLAVAVGPIAKVLVSRTAQRSAVRDEFLQLLAQHIESAAERDAFLRDMHTVVAP